MDVASRDDSSRDSRFMTETVTFCGEFGEEWVALSTVVESLGLRHTTPPSVQQVAREIRKSGGVWVLGLSRRKNEGGNFLQELESLTSDCPGVVIIVVAGDLSNAEVLQVVRRGVFDVLVPPAQRELMESMILSAARCASTRRQILLELREAENRMSALTETERQLMELVVHGWSTKRIAHSRDVTPQAVDATIRRALEKLELESRLEAAAFIHRTDALRLKMELWGTRFRNRRKQDDNDRASAGVESLDPSRNSRP